MQHFNTCFDLIKSVKTRKTVQLYGATVVSAPTTVCFLAPMQPHLNRPKGAVRVQDMMIFPSLVTSSAFDCEEFQSVLYGDISGIGVGWQQSNIPPPSQGICAFAFNGISG